MKKKFLIIDDIRTEDHIGLDTLHPEGDVLIARNYDLGIDALKKLGPWDVLYLDHDLTEGSKDGYEVVRWLEEQLFAKRPELLPKAMVCISSNPAGRQKIEKGWEMIQRYLQDAELFSKLAGNL